VKPNGTSAMEAQVEAEVESSITSSNAKHSEIYGKVASDYRENVRTADELVRGVTALLLGVGKLVRELRVQVSPVHSGELVINVSTIQCGVVA